VKKMIAEWAKKIGFEGSYAEQKGEWKPWGWWLANTIVFDKVREALGLTRCRLMYSAAAPISKDTLDYFNCLYIPIHEIYGMSECSGPHTVGKPHLWSTGSCGPAITGSETKLADPDADGNGEICMRGRHVFMGYLKNEKATAETIDQDGFLHSGDIGKLDDRGLLKITGRIKELIITAGGENIPPVLIEIEIKRELPEISNVMVVGDRRKFLCCIVSLKAKPIRDPQQGEYPFTDELIDDVQDKFKAIGAPVTTVTEAMKNEKVIAYLMAGLKRANNKASSQAQYVQKAEIIQRDFTLEGGELTATLKLRRKIVEQKYIKEIEAMYEGVA